MGIGCLRDPDGDAALRIFEPTQDTRPQSVRTISIALSAETAPRQRAPPREGADDQTMAGRPPRRGYDPLFDAARRPRRHHASASKGVSDERQPGRNVSQRPRDRWWHKEEARAQDQVPNFEHGS